VFPSLIAICLVDSYLNICMVELHEVNKTIIKSLYNQEDSLPVSN
jgi:hypothetical protein